MKLRKGKNVLKKEKEHNETWGNIKLFNVCVHMYVCMYKIMFYANRESFISSFPIWIYLLQR